LRRLKLISLSLLPLAALLFAQAHCPQPGCAITPAKRALVRLKNRDAPPKEEDFDRRVTLAALLQSGEDRARWPALKAATIEGYVVAVGDGAIEAANCFSLTRRDTHIDVALRPDAPPRERMVLEVTPRLREWARQQGLDWSTLALKRELTGHWCSFEGWLLFDTEHAEESENIAPGRKGNWRATSWELHPVTRLRVVR
jgi:hypothetical protein